MALPRFPSGSRRSSGSRFPGSRSSRSPRSRLTVGLLLLTAVTLLVVDLPGTRPLRPVRNAVATVFSPISALGGAILSPLSNGWKGAFNYDDLEKENDRLKAELDERKSQDARIKQLEADNAAFERMNGVTAEDVDTKLAEVVSGSISNFDQTVQINVGSNDGIKKGMAVMTGLKKGTSGGLFGRVIQVRANSATVELVTASDFKVGARVAGSDDKDDEDAPSAAGVLNGRGRERTLLMEGLDPDVPIAEGDWVYTSLAEQSQFPKNLAIGTVTSVRKVNGGLSQTIDVEPMADTSGAYVKVVLKDAPR